MNTEKLTASVGQHVRDRLAAFLDKFRHANPVDVHYSGGHLHFTNTTSQSLWISGIGATWSDGRETGPAVRGPRHLEPLGHVQVSFPARAAQRPFRPWSRIDQQEARYYPKLYEVPHILKVTYQVDPGNRMVQQPV